MVGQSRDSNIFQKRLPTLNLDFALRNSMPSTSVSILVQSWVLWGEMRVFCPYAGRRGHLTNPIVLGAGMIPPLPDLSGTSKCRITTVEISY